MATFDPKAHNKPKEPDGKENVPSGEYLLANVWFKRKTNGKKKPYLRMKTVVIYGPAKDRYFYDYVGIDMDSSGQMYRLAVLCEALGAEAFDLSKDNEVRGALLFKPFKGRVKRERNGQYINCTVERVIPELSPEERQACDRWVLERELEQEQRQGGGGGDDFGDDDGFGGGGGGGLEDPGDPGAGSPVDDDDIPF